LVLVSTGLERLLRTPYKPTSENPLKAKFAEGPFYEVGAIGKPGRLRRG